MYRNFKIVPRIIFGHGAFNQLGDILHPLRRSGGRMVFMLDRVFAGQALEKRLPLEKDDLVLHLDVTEEPTTTYVDALTLEVKNSGALPDGIIGIGGGASMDLAKAVALMLNNPGSAVDYQGWDLIKNPAVWHAAVPTISGTGAEISRTTVLIGPEKKLGINSDFTLFDQVLLDPELTAGVPKNQWFYTGMDCYIHDIESLAGKVYLNAFSKAYAEKSLELCHQVFLENDPESADKLMMASYFGGMSIAYSQVGACHALSYGLSFVLGIHHGVGCCIAFDALEDIYPEGVRVFREMMQKQGVSLPRGVTKNLSEADMERMIDVTLGLAPLWENCLGPDWKTLMPRDRVRDLYQRM